MMIPSSRLQNVGTADSQKLNMDDIDIDVDIDTDIDTDIDLDIDIDIDSNNLEYGPGTIYAGFPSSRGLGVGGQSYANVQASAVHVNMSGKPKGHGSYRRTILGNILYSLYRILNMALPTTMSTVAYVNPADMQRAPMASKGPSCGTTDWFPRPLGQISPHSWELFAHT